MSLDRSRAYAEWGVTGLLRAQPQLQILPGSEEVLVLGGPLRINAEDERGVRVTDVFDIEIRVDTQYPDVLPAVYETRGKVPAAFHRNSDGSLCLGAPIRLYQELHRTASLEAYVDKCLVPYLFQVALVQAGQDPPLGELSHGAKGVLEFYRDELRMPSLLAALDCVRLLELPWAASNAEACPCGSGRSLGACHSFFLDKLRGVRPREWFHREHKRLHASCNVGLVEAAIGASHQPARGPDPVRSNRGVG